MNLNETFKTIIVVGSGVLAQGCDFYGEDFNQDNKVTRDNIDSRTTLFEEENNRIQGETPWEIREPLGRSSAIFTQFLGNGLAADSVGFLDEREFGIHSISQYNAVFFALNIRDEGLYSSCTATAVYLEGVELKEPYKSVYATAAHCVNDVNLQNIFFSGTFFDEDGTSFFVQEEPFIRQHTLFANEVWINPLYKESLASQEAYNSNSLFSLHDTALVFSTAELPPQIEPASLLIEGQEAVINNSSLSLTTVGHASDLKGLSHHQCIDYARIEVNGVILSAADLARRASGGPVFVSRADDNGDCDLALNKDGVAQVVAVNASVEAGTEYAKHAYFTPEMLSTVPFVSPVKGDSVDACERKARIAQDGTNAYITTDEMSLKLVFEDKALTLDSNTQVTVHSDVGWAWSLVSFNDSNDDERHGYIPSNFLNVSDPCP